MATIDETRDEPISVQKIRQSVMDIEAFPTGRLLRWLHEYNNDEKVTIEALRAHVVFRKAWQLDALMASGWNGSQVLSKYCGYGFCGPDRDGAPVLVSPFGAQDVEGIIKSCQAQEYLKYCMMIIERGLLKCEQMALRTGQAYERMTLVLDLNHMTTDHYSCKPFAATFLTLIALFQEHYPNLVKKILVINAPSMARYTYQVLIPFLSLSTQTLIEMPADDWLDVVDKYIGLTSWPVELGGRWQPEHVDERDTNTPPASPHNTILRVPEIYYKDGQSSPAGFQHEITVHAGHKQVIEIEVAEAGSRICWRYATLTEDVGFSIYYDARGTAHDDTRRMSIVYPYIRLECTVVPVSGQLIAEIAGRYVIEFDNSYSWFSAKELKYTVEVFDP